MKQFIYGTLLLSVFLFIACGSDDSAKKGAKAGGNNSGLTDFQLKNGIGPITAKLTLGEIDVAKVKKGADLFVQKCSPCHKLDKRLVGPALRYVSFRRTPEYILNMILNPTGMVKDHPEARKVLGEYLSPMTDMHLTPDQAKEILEYIRSVGKEGKENNIPEVPLFRSSAK